MRSRLRQAAVLLLPVVLSACTFIEKDIGRSFKRDAQTLLASGEQLTVDEVLSDLGPPHQMLALADGYAFLYQRFDVKERQLGVSSDAPVLRWFKVSLADADSSSQSLVARFDASDQLVAASVVTQKEDLGESGSVMFALSFRSLVDASDLDSDVWGPGNWGQYLLQEPKVLLNVQSSPDTGEATLEQRGTPTNVGQRTMEFHTY